MKQKYIIATLLLILAAAGLFLLYGPDQKNDQKEFVFVEDVPDMDVESEGAFDDTEEAARGDITDHSKPPLQIVDDQNVEETLEDLPLDASLEKRFEVVLNKMLRDVAKKAAQYQEQRKIITQVANPDSFYDKAYVAENFQVFRDVIPSLNKASSEILDIFLQADLDVKNLIKDKPEDLRKPILDKWQALKQEQAGSYQRFFELESEVIEAYERLMRFYFIKRDFYDVDVDTGEIIFQNDSDKVLARKLILQVNRKERAQEQALALTP